MFVSLTIGDTFTPGFNSDTCCCSLELDCSTLFYIVLHPCLSVNTATPASFPPVLTYLPSLSSLSPPLTSTLTPVVPLETLFYILMIATDNTASPCLSPPSLPFSHTFIFFFLPPTLLSHPSHTLHLVLPSHHFLLSPSPSLPPPLSLSLPPPLSLPLPLPSPSSTSPLSLPTLSELVPGECNTHTLPLRPGPHLLSLQRTQVVRDSYHLYGNFLSFSKFTNRASYPDPYLLEFHKYVNEGKGLPPDCTFNVEVTGCKDDSELKQLNYLCFMLSYWTRTDKAHCSQIVEIMHGGLGKDHAHIL